MWINKTKICPAWSTTPSSKVGTDEIIGTFIGSYSNSCCYHKVGLYACPKCGCIHMIDDQL